MVKAQLIVSYWPSKSSSKESVALCQEEKIIFSRASIVAGKVGLSNLTKTGKFNIAMSTERTRDEKVVASLKRQVKMCTIRMVNTIARFSKSEYPKSVSH